MRVLKINNYIIETPIIDILTRLQITLTNGKLRDIKPSGDNIVVTCPVHDDGRESKPACNIYIGTDEKIQYGYFRCFVCDSQGPFQKFVAECFNSSVDFAEGWLIRNFGILSYEQTINLGDDIQLPSKKKPQITKVLDESILNTYQSYCPYLQQRGVSREVCERFNVKYDHINHQVVFPCYDSRGKLVMMPKRSIYNKVFYLDKDQEKVVYCLDYIIKNHITTAIITEGPFDCLTAYEYGYNAIATLGNISDSQIEQINRSGIRLLYLGMDNDKAGESFKKILSRKLSKNIILSNLVFPANKKDLNDLTKEELDQCINTARERL